MSSVLGSLFLADRTDGRACATVHVVMAVCLSSVSL